MNTSSVVIFVVVLCVICLIFKQRRSYAPRNEGFDTNFGYYKNYCSDCSSKGSQYECLRCESCGWATDNYGNEKCIPGDAYGSYFDKNTRYWNYELPGSMTPYNQMYPLVQMRTFPDKPFYRWRGTI